MESLRRRLARHFLFKSLHFLWALRLLLSLRGLESHRHASRHAHQHPEISEFLEKVVLELHETDEWSLEESRVAPIRSFETMHTFLLPLRKLEGSR